MRAFLLILLALLTWPAFAQEEAVLNVYNWANYMPDSVIQQFEKETGIKVNYSTFDSNETLYAKLKSTSSVGYDIVVPSSYFVDRMRREQMLILLDKTKLTNFKDLNPRLLNQVYDPHNQYSVPYLWGTTSIALNTRYYAKDSVKSWQDLWDPKYKDQLLLMDDVRDVFAVAMKTLGYSINDTNSEHIKQAYLKLKELLPNVRLFNAEALQTLYIDEDVTIGMGLSGDIFIANKEDPSIAYLYPKEGPIMWLDSLVIPKGAKHIENAYRFINFLLRPDIAAQVSKKIGYATPNLQGLKLLPAEIRNNPIIYPSPADLAHGEFQADLGNDVTQLYEKYWEVLKVGG